MKLLLIGKNGQLGWELQRACLTLGDVIALDYPEIDLADTAALRELIREIRPDILLNPAAYTDVEKAEIEFEQARKVNAIAPGVMAEEMKKLGGALIHYSTDYVFDGSKGSDYLESDTPSPLNQYGLSKLEGERAVIETDSNTIIFRTSWVYSLRVGGFVNKVLTWSRQQKILRIVDDQVGSPSWARMLAEATAQVIARGAGDPLAYLQQHRGLYHLAGAGAASRFEWAREVLRHDPRKEEQTMTVLQPAKSAEFPTAVKRPAYSALNCNLFERTFGLKIPDWKECVRLAFA